MKPAKESELAAQVVAYLERDKWDIYQEVHLDGKTADIVAVNPSKFVAVIECKMMFGFDVLSQAFHWKDYAHFVFVAVPASHRDWEVREFMRSVMKAFNFGWFEVSADRVVKMETAQTINRNANAGFFLENLKPEHKTHAKAGTNRGGHWTPFKDVAAAVATYVNAHPEGVSVKEICTHVPAVSTYYKKPNAARRNVREHCKNGVIKHVRCVEKNGLTMVFPFHPATSTEPRI